MKEIKQTTTTTKNKWWTKMGGVPFSKESKQSRMKLYSYQEVDQTTGWYRRDPVWFQCDGIFILRQLQEEYWAKI